jgi:hypothetical protein
MTAKGTFTDKTKVKVEGEFFEIIDLRENCKGHQSDCTYFGRSRDYMLKAQYSEADFKEQEEWDKAIELNNGDTLWIDGCKYHLVVKDVKASDGIMFVTDESMKYIKKMLDI